MAVIAVIATLDTKGAEAAFLKQTIEKMGCSVLLIDSGMGAAPTITPDLARDAVCNHPQSYFELHAENY